jgi:predicted phosphodiesterase
MKSDFEMIIREFPKNNDLTIVPISDVHLGAAEHMADAWEKFCKDVLNDPNTYVTLGGDLINNATRSSVSNIFKETMFPSAQKRKMAEMLKPLAREGRILCAVSGNHERRSQKDVDDEPMFDIMCKLDLEDIYRENMAFLKICIGKQNGDGARNPTYCLGVTHGAGGGIYTGGAVNRNERFGHIIDGLDGIIVGHTHKGAITKPMKINIDKHNNKITMRPFVVVSSVPWMAFGGYALQKMLLPAQSGDPQKLKLYGKEKKMQIIW